MNLPQEILTKLSDISGDPKVTIVTEEKVDGPIGDETIEQVRKIVFPKSGRTFLWVGGFAVAKRFIAECVSAAEAVAREVDVATECWREIVVAVHPEEPVVVEAPVETVVGHDEVAQEAPIVPQEITTADQTQS